MTKFEVGKTYMTSSIGDHNCIISARIKARTAKTVKAWRDDGKIQTFRISEFEGVEQFKPWGSFSMAPTIQATDTTALKRDWEQKAES